MASIDGQDPAHVRAEEEDPALDYSVEPDEVTPDETAWDEENGLIDEEEVLIEADPVDVAEQRRSVED
ncbi:hypothetical protein RBS60_11970 [Sinomonas sp. ASV486]|uniref:hypothetical protein n=1 Tax=Sinomonas sp. ASV486 TaxID=3051170 RepID=UPI0027DBC8A4|nr:hypothetical protein [Sinomonas sp. ASV486]MDQ4490911.1 hypothetical protein [Sinomonas sp. ASV486]